MKQFLWTVTGRSDAFLQSNLQLQVRNLFPHISWHTQSHIVGFAQKEKNVKKKQQQKTKSSGLSNEMKT